MFYTENPPVRYPKGNFAMWSVYSFTGASIIASIVFSMLLFLSIDDDPFMQVMFGSLAVIFELGKFFAWYEVGERQARRNYSGMILALVFYAVLAVISIGGSVGGINSATNKAQEHANVHQSKVNAYNMQIDSIDKQIELNNVAAKKYIQMELIATGVMRIQKENDKLRSEQLQLAMERDTMPLISQGSIIGLIDSLANALDISTQTAQLSLVIFLSVLLDFFAAFFVGLIGEENRFRYQFSHTKPITIDAFSIQELKAPDLLSNFEPHQVSSIHYSSEVEDVSAAPAISKTAYDLAIDALTAKQVNCSKRAVGKYLNISVDEVDQIFSRLFNQGIVSKKPNNHFQWHGVQQVGI